MTATEQGSPARARRTALIVAGMHRSGTSAMARVLSLAGGAMPERLINAGADNPLGFWEPRDMVALNDEILATLGSAWNDVFGFQAAGRAVAHHDEFRPRARSVLAMNYPGDAPAVAKDPRVSLLTPLWREAMEAEALTPAFVIMVRDPLEVAQSIAARDGAPVQASMLAWLGHMVAVERDTRDAARVFVSYDALIEDWETVLERVRDRLATPLPVSADRAAEISGFLSRSARHHATDDAAWIDRTDLWPGVADAWRWLKSAAQGAGPPEPFPEHIMKGLADLEAQFGPVLKAQKQQAALRERDMQSVIADRETTALRLRARFREYESVIAETSQALTVADHRVAEARSELAAIKAETKRREKDGKTARAASLEAHARDRQALDQAREEVAAARRHIEQLEQNAAAAVAETAQLRSEVAGAAAQSAGLKSDLAAAAEEKARLALAAEAEMSQLKLDLAAAVSEASDHRGQAAAFAETIDRMTETAENARTALVEIEAQRASLKDALDAAQGREADLQTEKAAVEARSRALSAELDAVAHKLDTVLASPSWSLTRPIRVVSKRVRALKTGG